MLIVKTNIDTCLCSVIRYLLAENIWSLRKFFTQMVKALGIIIDRRPKGSPRKRENKIIEKIGCVHI